MHLVPDDYQNWLRPYLTGTLPWGNAHFGDDSLPDLSKADQQLPWRSFSIPRVLLLLSGKHQFVVMRHGEAHRVELRPGDTFYFRPNLHEHELFESDCAYLCIVFLLDYVRLIWVNYGEDRFPLARRTHHWPEQPPEHLSAQLRVLTEISRLPADPALGRSATEVFWRLTDHWLSQTDFHPVQLPHAKARASWIKVLHYLNDSYHLPITRQTAATELHLSPNRIYVLCREFGRKGFQQLLEEKRIEQAKNYLANSDLKIEAVATLCGYTSATYFIRTFRKLTGQSPGQWRLQPATSGSRVALESKRKKSVDKGL